MLVTEGVCREGNRKRVTHQVVAHGDEQIEEEWGTTILHLNLHSAAALERVAAANDEGEIVRPQFAVRGRCVGVGVSS